MGTLLKDMPIHAEKIENNFSLLGQISDEIETACIVDSSNNYLPNAEVDNPRGIAQSILNEIVDFVNQNYEWKGLKA